MKNPPTNPEAPIYLANIRTIALNIAIPAILYIFFNEKSWWSPLSIGFLSGCGLMVLCIAKCFPNNDNKTDYFKAYGNFLHMDKITEASLEKQ